MKIQIAHTLTAWWGYLAALVGLVAFGTFLDGGGGDPAPAAGADPAPADAGDPAPDEGDPAAAPAAGEDDDDEDVGLTPEVANNPTRLRTRLRRAQRQLAEFHPIVNRLRGTDGKFVDVNQILHKAREFDALDEQFRRNPNIRRVLGMDGGAQDTPQEVPFDESQLPFDPTTPEGRYFAGLARDAYEAKQVNQRLMARLDAIERGSQQQTLAAVETSWKDATMAAARQIEDQGVREMFVEAMYGHFINAKQQRLFGKVDVRALIQQRLTKLQVGAGTKKRAGEAAAQRMAETNGSLPRAPRPAGTPASPQRPAQKPNDTVRDVTKRFLAAHT